MKLLALRVKIDSYIKACIGARFKELTILCSYANTQNIENRGVGVIDMDYTGNISVMFKNITNEVLVINEHDRIAQLVLAKCLMHNLPVSEEARKHGFGSTGV